MKDEIVISHYDLPSRPVQNREGAIKVDLEGRKNQLRVCSAVYARTKGKLENEALEAAWDEIEIYPKIIQNPGFIRSMSFFKLSGLSSITEARAAWELRVKKNYEAWASRIKTEPQTFDMTLNMVRDHWSIDKARKKYHISERKVLVRLIWALNEYSIISGWGNQMDPEK